MKLDDLITTAVLVVLFLAVAALVLARGYLRRNDLLYAVETLWYTTLALVLCLALTVWTVHWRVRSDIDEVWDYVTKFEEKYGGGQP